MALIPGNGCWGLVPIPIWAFGWVLERCECSVIQGQLSLQFMGKEPWAVFLELPEAPWLRLQGPSSARQPASSLSEYGCPCRVWEALEA